jgi:uncharacterized membrane protein YkoI
MRKEKLIVAALTAVLLVATPAGGFAAQYSDLQSMIRAKLSLTQAIETAEQQGSGKAIKAEFEAGDDKPPRYEIKVLGDDKLVTYTLDADTGKVLETENDRIEKLFTRLRPEDVRAAPTTLAQAIGIAEQRAGGKAVEAEIDRESNSVSYAVTVAKADGSERDVHVNGATGKVVEER